MLKAIIVKQGKEFQKNHNLIEVYNCAGINLTENQKYLIEYLTETLMWFKYHVPKKEEEWNRFTDEVFEALIIRGKKGKTFSTVEDNEIWPSFDSYLKLWNEIINKYEEI